MPIPGPFGDGYDELEYQEAITDACEFFGCSEDEAKQNLQGFRIFKEAADAHGLDYAYDHSAGSIWDLLSVRCTVSQGHKERERDDVVYRILDRFYQESGRQGCTILDYGCGIGREVLSAAQAGFTAAGVERGLTAQFASWYVRKRGHQASILSELEYNEKYGSESLDGILCFEYFEHDPDPIRRVNEFWDKLKPGGMLVCNARSFNAHDTGHLPENFKFQFEFEAIISEQGFKCVYFPWNPPNIWNIVVFQKVGKTEGFYGGATTSIGNW